MLEYIKHKKAKKSQPQSPESKSPVLSPADEQFLEQIVSREETPPPLPERHSDHIAEDLTGNAEQEVTENRELQPEEGHSPEKAEQAEKKTEGRGDVKKGNKKWSFLQRKFSKKDKKKAAEVQADTTEEQDISIALEKLNLAAEGNSAFSPSKETRELVQKFTVILKDLVNGVPTAYDDLVKFFDDSSSEIQKSYSKMPSFLQKLVSSLPTKLKTTLAPELLAVAAESQGLHPAEAATAGTGGVLKAAAGKAGVAIPTLKELVTKPSAIVGMLKAIMNVLKLRWPAFIGTNVLWSLGLMVLLFVLWYCHKRGKEVRLEREKSEDDAREKEIMEDGKPSETAPTEVATTTTAPGNGGETQHETPTQQGENKSTSAV
ncbi:hypothetical protein GP486_001301 [Trichoglossum hirsutum]|uniref:Ring-like domain-containing protein n=1 Tax=Trichoglossum hirsutum TaxID=265104 RepID=A0A9P8LH38_9PEZI|nr:hypothetical protein GP486_001301 [Trichoglossum hirsutum]